MSSPSRWLTWAPSSSTIEKKTESELPKQPKPDSGSFGSPALGLSRNIDHPEDGCKTPIQKSIEPIVPNQADCGCEGSVCPRCWLCTEHCHCLPQQTCQHCGGEGRCACTACWKSYRGEPARCVVCHGTGRLAGRLQ